MLNGSETSRRTPAKNEGRHGCFRQVRAARQYGGLALVVLRSPHKYLSLLRKRQLVRRVIVLSRLAQLERSHRRSGPAATLVRPATAPELPVAVGTETLRGRLQGHLVAIAGRTCAPPLLTPPALIGFRLNHGSWNYLP